MRLATTGTYRDGARVRRLPGAAVSPRRARTLARRDAAADPRRPTALCDELRALDPARRTPLELPERRVPRGGCRGECAVLACCRTATRSVRRSLRRAAGSRPRRSLLSPLHAAPRLRAPVEIATAPRDRYFPLAEAQALAAASPQVRLTVTSLLAHATPRLSPRYLAELGRLNGFFVRALAAVR